ncbi:hypothetical protein PHYSODRAFT_552074 [Phytophthora sojae]|uniref:DUF3668 domain-containing protein n=1 Tax=Phytophthora sojae (strain P6497) TaxID=1094619 RepID=G4YFC0_PHYSP|nr:hypothetical protein PHYSODRAFT_552074 [Phytophthora sojae]EGZ28346.1 hypothetical protein PHYSODRAFT_552074 [Phytophthora sojae]|eukprot:XP_009515621.1 hypothetical protein PHYSODRAFT_552074 [Phytophthora sojae]
MDNTPWTYTVSALQVRMLRIPVSESAAVRELRVFATIDKQAAQSRGSKWKQELQPTGGSPLRSTTTKKSTRRKPLPTGGRFDAYRRSGPIEEAKWVRGDGKLQWTFPMEKFRRLKAYAPRIKAFVYGIGDTVIENHSQAQMEHLARQEKDSPITSFGWFFLDLRTPDLPERWLKLQNSPFGGEVLISSTFSPGTISPGSPRPTNRSGKAPTASTVVSGDNGEYLQIGDSDGQEIFVLSVFIQAALNLSKVVEAAINEDRDELERTGFWLSYSLFDVVVQTDVFYNLSVAEFSPIRDSFRVKSSLRDLALCIEDLACLTVFMCTENRVLAGVEIPLLPILSKELFSSSDGKDHELNPGDTSEIEGTFSFPDFDEAVVTASVTVEFVESEKSKFDTLQRPADMSPSKQLSGIKSTSRDTTEQSTFVNISGLPSEKSANEQILFKLDHLRLKSATLAPFTGAESILIEVAIGEQHSSGNLAFCAFTRHHAYATSPAVGVLLENVSSQTAVDTPIRIRCLLSDSDQLVANSSMGSISIAQDDEGYPKSIVLQIMNEASRLVGQCRLVCSRGSAARQMLGRKLLDETSSEKHHYRICLRLKSVRDIELPGGYCLRYQNPFLSSALRKSLQPF